MSEVRKVPLFVEIIGEPATGKTHLSCLFPKPALFDTTAKGEGYLILKKLHTDWKKRYFRIRKFSDILAGLKYIEANKESFKTIVVDTAADLRGLAIDECLEELKKEKPDRQKLMPEEYYCVNKKTDGFVETVTDPNGKFCMNLVFTAQMKDEWVKRESTGRRIRDGHPKANFQCDIRLYLELKNKLDTKTMQLTDEVERVCRVMKCRTRDRTNKDDWLSELKPDELNWSGIKKLIRLDEGEVVE